MKNRDPERVGCANGLWWGCLRPPPQTMTAPASETGSATSRVRLNGPAPFLTINAPSRVPFLRGAACGLTPPSGHGRPMFEGIQKSLSDAFKKLRGRGRLTAENIREGMGEV